ncbi:MAG: hypothetical protein ACOH2A_00195 [Sphingobacteriaceae bacterium]
MKKIFWIWCLMASTMSAYAQELYVNTEPASNMATNSLGIRLENQGTFNPGLKNRTTLELMYGASKSLMIHASGYLSNVYQQNQRLEGYSAYAKYRFLSVDTVQRHFRGAVFLKAAKISNPIFNQDITLEGDNTGIQTGLVFTQLAHKLALSGSASYLRDLSGKQFSTLNEAFDKNALSYTLSAGYLLYPKNYTSYDQTNMNIYLEILGKNNFSGQNYIDISPAVQFIFNSVFRLDLSYRMPLIDNMERNSKNMYLVRLEYNFFNVF